MLFIVALRPQHKRNQRVFFHSQVRLIKTYSKRKAPFHLEHPIFSIHEEEKALPSPNSSQTTRVSMETTTYIFTFTYRINERKNNRNRRRNNYEGVEDGGEFDF